MLNRVTRREIETNDKLAMGLAHRDIEIYLRILSGASVPPEVDLEELMDRVDLWERQRIFEMPEQEKGSYWWLGLLATCIYDAWRRKVGEALARGDSWRVVTTTMLTLKATGATALLVVRQVFFPLAPIGLQPLRTILIFTA